jgi:hypothetical protein
MAGYRSPVHRVRVVTPLTRVRVQAAIQQEIPPRGKAVLRCRVQQRSLARLLMREEHLRMFVAQRDERVHLAMGAASNSPLSTVIESMCGAGAECIPRNGVREE